MSSETSNVNWRPYKGFQQALRKFGSIGALVRDLAETGATPNQSFCGESILGIAATRGDSVAVKTLLELGAEPDGGGPNHCAPPVVNCLICPRCLRMLLAYGADVNARGPYGWTILHHAILNLEYGDAAERENRMKVLELALESGANPNLRDDRGHGAFQAATFAEKQEEILAILKRYKGAPMPDRVDRFFPSAARVLPDDLDAKLRRRFLSMSGSSAWSIFLQGTDITFGAELLSNDRLELSDESLAAVASHGMLLITDPIQMHVRTVATLKRRHRKHLGETSRPATRKDLKLLKPHLKPPTSASTDPLGLNDYPSRLEQGALVRAAGFETGLIAETIESCYGEANSVSNIFAETRRIRSKTRIPCELAAIAPGYCLLTLGRPILTVDELAAVVESRFRLDDARGRAISDNITGAEIEYALAAAHADLGQRVLRFDWVH